jgi:multidrug efflux pump subunit AcrA (membrane-fusion protein)
MPAEIEVQSVVVNLIAEVELAEEAGPLVELSIVEGSRVKAGDLIARLHDRDTVRKLLMPNALKHAQQPPQGQGAPPRNCKG